MSDTLLYMYVQSEPGLWTVGAYGKDGKWHPDSDHTSKDRAARQVALLNGSSQACIDAVDTMDKQALTIKRLYVALERLVRRCDGEEGVRADGSNIDTAEATALLEYYEYTTTGE